MSDFWTPLQSAVFQKLTQHPVFQATGATYYPAYVPDDAAYPYVATPGDAVSRPWYTMGDMKGEELIWSFHVWCDLDNGGPTKTRQIASAIMQAMDDAAVSATGYHTLMFRRIHSTPPMRQQNDPKLFQQVIRYRVILQQA